MAVKTIAYLTDAHLDQKIILDQQTGAMRYAQQTGEHRDQLKFILGDITRKGIDEIIFGGDIGTQEANQWFFNTIDEFNFKLLMVLGNHDTYQKVTQYYQHEYGNQYLDEHSNQYLDKHSKEYLDKNSKELNYAYEEGQFKFIYLDSSSNAISDAQLNWFRKELETDKEILLFIHHPVLEIKTPLDKIGAALNGRDEIKHILSEAQKDSIVFCGHYHMTDELVEEKIRQYSSPACSYQIEKLSDKIEIDTLTFGYRLITINGRKLSTEVKLFNSL